MSRSASAAPRSPATVENRANISQLLPTWLKIAAFVYWLMSWVTRNVPKAPEPLACMRRSGMTSRAKWASFSISHRSCRSSGPRGPALMLFWLSVTGAPAAVVSGLVFSSNAISSPWWWVGAQVGPSSTDSNLAERGSSLQHEERQVIHRSGLFVVGVEGQEGQSGGGAGDDLRHQIRPQRRPGEDVHHGTGEGDRRVEGAT